MLISHCSFGDKISIPVDYDRYPILRTDKSTETIAATVVGRDRAGPCTIVGFAHGAQRLAGFSSRLRDQTIHSIAIMMYTDTTDIWNGINIIDYDYIHYINDSQPVFLLEKYLERQPSNSIFNHICVKDIQPGDMIAFNNGFESTMYALVGETYEDEYIDGMPLLTIVGMIYGDKFSCNKMSLQLNKKVILLKR